jgi:fatty-acyl-CoA synthase
MMENSYWRTADSAEFRDWCVGDLLRDAVRQAPDRLALVVPAAADRGERTWTYRELLRESELAADALLRHFIAGDRIATLAGAGAEILLLQMGAALAGVVLVTLNPASRPNELSYFLTQSAARGIFLDRSYRKADNAAALQGVAPNLPNLQTIVYLDEWASFIQADTGRGLPAVRADSPALILFTSGTTGKPKGVVLRHRSIVNNARFSTERIALESGSVWLNLLPMFHVGGSVTITLGCFSNLGTQIMLPEFNADAALEVLQRHAVRMTMAVPTMLYGMLRSGQFPSADLSALEIIVTGGAAIPPDLVREVERRFGVEVMAMFGQTEAGGCMCLTRRGDRKELVTESVGTPLPLSEAKIISTQHGGILPVGEVGEICVRTGCAMMEYFRMPMQTGNVLDGDGWVHTGDLGLMRSDGYLQIKGRLKDMIIRGGENIYPREIEDLLAGHPCVAQAAVFGVPDDTWGEQVAAAVMLKPDKTADPESLTLYLQENIARHKVPKVWQFVTSFPLNTSGKIQKFVLQEQYAQVHSVTKSKQ